MALAIHITEGVIAFNILSVFAIARIGRNLNHSR